MNFKFQCATCNHRLECGLKCIGEIMICPSCENLITVPRPTREFVNSEIRPTPRPMPDETLAIYQDKFEKLIRYTNYNVKLCEYCQAPEMKADFVEDAVSTLNNLSAFLTRIIEDSVDTAKARPTQVGDAHSENAGKSKRRRFRDFEEGDEAPSDHGLASQLLLDVQAAIQKLKAT